MLFLLLVTALPIRCGPQDQDAWLLYGLSQRASADRGRVWDWYALNKLAPSAPDEATAEHYVSEGSLDPSLIAEAAIVRIWERSVFRRPAKPFEEARREVLGEEERRLGRKLGIIDMPGLFPLVVSRAVKEVRTLFEINCYSNEFTILEVNIYDSEGSRMVREAGFNTDIWMPIAPGTLMDAFAKKACGRAS